MKRLKKKSITCLSIVTLIIYIITGCDLFVAPSRKELSADTSKSISVEINNVWTWMAGANLIWQDSVVSVNSIENTPAGRFGAAGCTDSTRNFWLFGGFRDGPNGGKLSDLWKFDGVKWGLISGSTTPDQLASYGTQRISSSSNNPGARSGSSSWVDISGNFWLFGGQAYDSSSGKTVDLNDLWKFDGTNWTWMTGSGSSNQSGEYGEKNISNANNTPAARTDAVSLIDSFGNFWLFGGWSIDDALNEHYYNDLWKFDGANWTWISGSSSPNQTGAYGVLKITDANNMPGARISIGWIALNSNLYFFGGSGYDSAGNIGNLNDLWKFDGTNWTWLSGSNLINSGGVYNEKGIANSLNKPGARDHAYNWIDEKGDLWLFGGIGIDGFSLSKISILNDLWKFDGSNWTWISGYNTTRQLGSYGEKGVSDISNLTSSRYYGASFKDSSGNFWLFGGSGLDVAGSEGGLNDLWKYKP